MLISTQNSGMPLLNSYSSSSTALLSDVYKQYIGHANLILNLRQDLEEKDFNVSAETRASVTKSLCNKICLIAFKN